MEETFFQSSERLGYFIVDKSSKDVSSVNLYYIRLQTLWLVNNL